MSKKIILTANNKSETSCMAYKNTFIRTWRNDKQAQVM